MAAADRRREALEALTRKEIQQLAMDANIKANQKTASLIDQLLGAGVAFAPQLSPLAHRACAGKESEGRRAREPLADLCNRSGEARILLTPTMPRPAAGCRAAAADAETGEEDALSHQLAAVSLGALPAGEGHGEHAGAKHVGAAGQSASSASPPVFAPWEEEDGELETIRETLAQLLELGFSEDEAQWAIDEAKKRCQTAAAPGDTDDGLADQLDKLSLYQHVSHSDGHDSDRKRQEALPSSPPATSCQQAASPKPSSPSPSTFCAPPPTSSAGHQAPPQQQQDERGQTEREQAPRTGIQQVLDVVLPRMDTWTLSFRAVLVSHAWQLSALKALTNKPDAASHTPTQGRQVEDAGEDPSTAMAVIYDVPHAAFRAKFPWARFLAEGGFKKVYLVYNGSNARQEALSVMDLAAMQETGNAAVAEAEVRLSFLLSRLVQLNRCPHFVQVYQFLRSSTSPPPDWGDAENKAPKGSLSQFLSAVNPNEGTKPPPRAPRGRAPKTRKGDFQYIRMEFCDGGDVEEALREHPRPPARVVVWLLRQMALALFFAQQEMNLRHYDVKLLNFFLKSEVRSTAKTDIKQEQMAPTNIATVSKGTWCEEGGGGDRDSFWEGDERGWVVKLADYGTAEIDCASMSAPLENRHVTTWENVLPSFLLYGDAARQDYSSDLHALGLCLLHLTTGDAPYEEVVAGLTCPPALASSLRSIWLNMDSKKSKKKYIKGGGKGGKGAREVGGRGGVGWAGVEEEWGERYRWVAALLEDVEEEEVLLQDTLYRNLVLFAPHLAEVSLSLSLSVSLSLSLSPPPSPPPPLSLSH
jgi:serine/threonine protein kinase